MNAQEIAEKAAEQAWEMARKALVAGMPFGAGSLAVQLLDAAKDKIVSDVVKHLTIKVDSITLEDRRTP